MDLDQQIQALIEDAPKDGTTPQLVAAIAPVLKQMAGQLRHLQYYIVQTLSQNWAITTLTHQTQPDQEKNVVYAFSSLKDVASSPYPIQDPEMIALPIPVTHILFQLVASEQIDSTIFFESPGNVMAGTEIQRQELADQIQAYLYTQPPAVPPDIA